MPVEINYADLVSTDCLPTQLEQAFGPSGLGLLVVKSVPEYAERRRRTLPLAAAFANLPDSVKAKYEHEPSSYNVGWSCGKEVLENGQPDVNKGSFYANPLLDEPSNDIELIKQYPADLSANLWPKAELPELETQFKALGSLMFDVGLLLVKHCDKYILSKVPSYSQNRLTNVLQASRCHKGRLLHYFPISSSTSTNEKARGARGISWCGWHKDHGLLTGLTSAMFLDSQGNEQPCADPDAGLMVKNRAGEMVKVSIGPDDLAFQVGEVMQVLSGGLLQATPHAVIGPRPEHAAGLSRNTLAVFMQPNYDEMLDPPPGRDDLETVAVDEYQPGLSFGRFSSLKFKRYYSSGKMEVNG